MRCFTSRQSGIDVFDDRRQIDDGVDQVMRAGAFEHLDDAGPLTVQPVGRQGLVLLVGQAQGIAGTGQRDRESECAYRCRDGGRKAGTE